MIATSTVLDLLSSPLMQRALVMAVLIGVTAPVVGTFLVQRRLALLGDGIGHITLTGVAAGWLAGSVAGLAQPDALALPGAALAAVTGSVAIEWVRSRGRMGSDVAMAIMFYGGIAAGVLLITIAGGTSQNLMSYLFGSISTVSRSDVVWTTVLVVVVLTLTLGLRGAFFAVSHDEDSARAAGLPVTALTMALATVAALTVTVAMRAVGLLLVSALMVVPVAAARVVARSHARTMALAAVIGASVATIGLVVTYWWDVPPGAAIVVLAIAVYGFTSALARPGPRPHAPAAEDPTSTLVPVKVHDGHRGQETDTRP